MDVAGAIERFGGRGRGSSGRGGSDALTACRLSAQTETASPLSLTLSVAPRRRSGASRRPGSRSALSLVSAGPRQQSDLYAAHAELQQPHLGVGFRVRARVRARARASVRARARVRVRVRARVRTAAGARTG